MARELICTAIKIAIAKNDAASDHGIIRRETDARFLDKMTEPLARNPTQCIAQMLACYSLQLNHYYDIIRELKSSGICDVIYKTEELCDRSLSDVIYKI
jgi:hypothetical protein